MGVIFYLKVQAAGRRRRRSLDGEDVDWGEMLVEDLPSLVAIGLEEFEEKIDKIAEGEDDGENSWISKIYNQFSFFNDGENTLEENDMDGLEPPLLDDPMLDMMYHKKKVEDEKVEREEKVEKAKPKKKRERLIVNPDFVENLDTDGVGSVQR